MTVSTNLIKVLPYEPLTKIDESVQLSALAIRKLKKEIYANARSVSTTLGGGDLGHLGLTMRDEEYATLQPANDQHPFVMPDHPALPNYQGTAGEVATQKATYDAAVEEYNTAHSLEKQLKNQLLKAVPHIFTQEIEHQEHGFAMVTTADILEHLLTTYGTLTPDDMDENMLRLQRPWDPDTPIETVFNNVADCRQTAEAGTDPISETM
ncbi:MAG: hypothetical protein ACRDCK_01800, partial [Plesiomonas shigelloides]